MVTFRNVIKDYSADGQTVRALDGVSSAAAAAANPLC